MRIFQFNTACLTGHFFWLFYFITLDNHEIQIYLYYLINELQSVDDCSCNYPGINGNSSILGGRRR